MQCRNTMYTPLEVTGHQPNPVKHSKMTVCGKFRNISAQSRMLFITEIIVCTRAPQFCSVFWCSNIYRYGNPSHTRYGDSRLGALVYRRPSANRCTEGTDITLTWKDKSGRGHRAPRLVKLNWTLSISRDRTPLIHAVHIPASDPPAHLLLSQRHPIESPFEAVSSSWIQSSSCAICTPPYRNPSASDCAHLSIPFGSLFNLCMTAGI